MSTLLIWSLLIGAITLFLTIELTQEWYINRSKRGSRTHFLPFLRRWARKNKAKLAIMAAVIIVFALALFLQDYTLALPDFLGRVRIPKMVRWGLYALLAVTLFVTVDLFKAWRVYRTNKKGQRATGPSFYRWWFKSSAKRICIVGGIAVIALGGTWVTLRYDLLHQQSQSARYMASADRYYRQQKFREATLELRNAIKVNPDDYDAHLWLARCQWRLGNLPEARDAYEKAVRLEPKLYAAFLELGRLSLAMGFPEKAAVAANQALLLEPQAAEPRMLLARIGLTTGKGERAAEQYRAILATNPADNEVRNLLIGLFLSRRSFAEADREAQAGLKLNPQDTKLKAALAVARDGQGQRKEAELLLKDAATQDSGSPLPLVALGELYVRHREYIPALQFYEEALKRSPNDKTIINNIALLHAEYGYDLKRAAELAYRIYARYPREPAVADTMGWVLFKQGKLDQALPILQFAAGGAPNNPAHRYHYGAALLKAGKSVAGRKEVETALKISSDFDGFAEARNLLSGNRR